VLQQVYKSLQTNLGLSGSHRNMNHPSGSSSSSSAHSQAAPASSSALAERMSILSYLCSISSNTDVSSPSSHSLTHSLCVCVCVASMFDVLMEVSVILNDSLCCLLCCVVLCCVQAANTVLNTVFVNLLLHILKAPAPTSKTHAHSHSHSHSQSLKGHHSSLSARALAATALALFLRYATYVQPPKAPRDKDKDAPPASLLAVLATLLRDPSLARQDAPLRHRALAALGEMVFYISAQEEDEGEGGGGVAQEGGEHKWALPLAAVSVLAKALGDESDEVARHYAAKVTRVTVCV
jgi:hypothetical protein